MKLKLIFSQLFINLSADIFDRCIFRNPLQLKPFLLLPLTPSLTHSPHHTRILPPPPCHCSTHGWDLLASNIFTLKCLIEMNGIHDWPGGAESGSWLPRSILKLIFLPVSAGKAFLPEKTEELLKLHCKNMKVPFLSGLFIPIFGLKTLIFQCDL